jgi:hypothetical protein
VTRPHHFTLPQAKARRSRDAEYHLCLYPTEDTLRCFYALMCRAAASNTRRAFNGN